MIAVVDAMDNTLTVKAKIEVVNAFNQDSDQ